MRDLPRYLSLALAISLPVLSTGGVAGATPRHANTAAAGTNATAPQALVRDANLSTAGVETRGTYVGAVAAAKRVKLDIVLAPSSPAALQKFVDAVSSPSSRLYHHFLTQRQFSQQFAPRKAVVKEATAWLTQEGFSVVRGSTFVITATGTVSTTASALGVKFDRFKGVSGATGFVAVGAPMLPRDLAAQVTGIVGLDTLDRPQYLGARPVGPGGRPPLSLRKPILAAGARPVQAAAALQPSACSDATTAAGTAVYTIDQLSPLYQMNNVQADGQYGAGVTVALPEIGAISTQDISAFDQCYGLTTQPTIVQVGTGPTQGPEEADLDFEEMATLAPGAAITVYEGPATLAGLYDMMDQIVTADKAKVISLSIGECESAGMSSYASSLETLLEQAAAQGQSVFAASGDSGSEDCFSDSGQGPTGTSLSVDYPASSPLVTAVGGTVATGGGELAWDDCNGTGNITCADQLASAGGVGASGGGVSTLYPNGPQGQPVLPGSGGARELPDVSANAGSNSGHGVEVYTDGSWQAFIGTSLAAPIWAALVADRDSLCTTPAGDFNPALYSLYGANGQGYGVAFNAVTQGYAPGSGFQPEAGTNDYTQTNSGAYPVTQGYNMATGIGSPIATGLACSQVTGTYSGEVGQQVTFTGIGLEHAAIHFGAQAASVVSESATSATVVVPQGQGSVTVTASSPVLGQSTQGAAFSYSTTLVTTTTTTLPATTTTTVGTTTTTVGTTTTTVGTTTTTSGGVPPGPPASVPATTTTTANVQSPVTSTPAPTTTTTASVPRPTPTQGAHRRGHGYWLVDRRGQVFSFGLGKSPAGPSVPRSETVVGIAPTPDELGYWLVATDGRVFTAGDARNYGDIPHLAIAPVGSKEAHHLAAPIVGIVPTLDGKGYLLVGSDGGIFAFGDAKVSGSCNKGGTCSGPVVAAVADPAAQGYWLVTRTGHVYAYGQARRMGQCTSAVTSRHSAAVAAAASSSGRGLWVLTARGTVCHVGSAGIYHQLSGPTPEFSSSLTGAAIVPVFASAGYWVVTSAGQVLCYGAAPQFGDLPRHHSGAPLVAAAGW